MAEKYDVLVIGGGVTGAQILRELARYRLRIALLEKEHDLACGATGANSAIIHAGYDPEPGTKKAYFNVLGSRMYEQVCRELDILYKHCPSLVIAYDEEQAGTVAELVRRGQGYGVEGVKLIDKRELEGLEPNISESAVCALYAPSSAIIEPWMAAIGAAENAMDNGAVVFLNAEVTDISKITDGYIINCADGREFAAGVVINAAGLGAAKIHNMICAPSFEIKPRRGSYAVLDCENLVKNILFPCPTNEGKGILITPEFHGKTMLGPDSRPVDGGESDVDMDDIAKIRGIVPRYLKREIPFAAAMRTFAGVRPAADRGDFIIEQPAGAPGFIDVAGIESPGLASAPAIARHVAGMSAALLDAKKDPRFNPCCRPRARSRLLDYARREELIKKDAKFSRVICRCEAVTEADIIDAIRRSCGASGIKGVKIRAGSGFGRCQGGFCQPEVLEILARELGIPEDEVLYNGPGSNVLTGKLKKGMGI